MICKIFNLLEKYTLKLFLLLWVFFFFLRISSLKRSWEYYLINLWNFLVTLVTNVLVSISQMEKLGSERLICLCKLTYHVNSYVLRRTYGSCLVGYYIIHYIIFVTLRDKVTQNWIPIITGLNHTLGLWLLHPNIFYCWF